MSPAIEAIKTFFGKSLNLTESDEEYLNKGGFTLESVLTKIAKKEIGQGLTEGTKECFTNYHVTLIDEDNVKLRLKAANYTDREASELVGRIRSLLYDNQAFRNSKVYNQEIQTRCNAAINKLADIANIESLTESEEKEMNELFSFISKADSMANMELSDVQRAMLMYNCLSQYSKLDGVPEEKLRLYRAEKCARLFKQVDDNQRLLIYSPPFSGKTALAQLFKSYAILVKKETVLLISCSRMRSDTTEDKFLDLVIGQYKPALIELVKQANKEPTYQNLCDQMEEVLKNPKTIVVLDDAQNVYGLDFFWDRFKENTSQRLLCLSSYSHDATLGRCHTPVIFSKTLSIYSLILFTRSEARDLAEKFIDGHDFMRNVLNQHVQDEIYAITSGYPGLVFFGYSNLSEKIKDKSSPEISLVKMLTDHTKVRCFKSIKTITREFSPSKDSESYLEAKRVVLVCLDEAISNIDLTSAELAETLAGLNLKYFLPEEYIERLVKMCVLYETNERTNVETLQFAIPLFKFYYMEELCAKIYSWKNLGSQEALSPSDSVSTIVTKLISTFDQGYLRLTKSRSLKSGSPLEAAYDWLVFYGLNSLSVRSISPQMHACQNGRIKGWLDYHINSSFNIGIELLVNGDRFNHHLDRFSSTGSYNSLSLTAHAIIDFYSNEQKNKAQKTIEKLQELKVNNYFIVTFDQDYSMASLSYLESNPVQLINHQVNLKDDQVYKQHNFKTQPNLNNSN